MRLCVAFKIQDSGSESCKITIQNNVQPARYLSTAPGFQGEPTIFRLGGGLTWYSNSIATDTLPICYTFKKSIYLKDLNDKKLFNFTCNQVKSCIKNKLCQIPPLCEDQLQRESEQITDFINQVYTCEDYQNLVKAFFLLLEQCRPREF